MRRAFIIEFEGDVDELLTTGDLAVWFDGVASAFAPLQDFHGQSGSRVLEIKDDT